jgi:hypothetical protein
MINSINLDTQHPGITRIPLTPITGHPVNTENYVEAKITETPAGCMCSSCPVKMLCPNRRGY